MTKRESGDYQHKVKEMVARELHYCVSSLVWTLAQGANSAKNGSDLMTLCDQAAELFYSVPDYEEAAIQEGFRQIDGFISRADQHESYNDWQEACDANKIEPYQWEIYEHWIVSDWLARKLEAKGHRVDYDFAGMTVWGRPTTGQAIAMDDVICQIYDEGPGQYDKDAAA